MRAMPFMAAIAGLALGGCGRDQPPRPTFALLFPPVSGELMTISSPNAIDLDGDGVLDIVFGVGVERVKPSSGRMVFTPEPEISGHVVAVSGATNAVLWKSPNPRDAFTTPRFALLDRDRVPDVIMGGREGVLTAFSGAVGAVLWRVEGKDVAKTPFPYNFYTPAVIDDANGDGVVDLIATHGGNDMRTPKDPRDPGFLAVISGADGAVLRVVQAPDDEEIYSSPVVYERPDGSEWVLFGTGGETRSGAMYRVPVASLLDGTFSAKLERVVAPGKQKGMMAPPTVVQLTGDQDPDIVVSTFDGRVIVVDGALGRILWEREDAGEEAYHSAAVVRLGDDGRLALFVSRGIGVFPRYVGSVHRLLDARDGDMLYHYQDPYYPAGAPLAVDLTGDGVDEPIFFSGRFPSAQGARIHVLHLPSREIVSHDVPDNFWSTPIVADIARKGALELIGLSWRVGDDRSDQSWKSLSWQLLRMELSARTPTSITWGGYMGSNRDAQYRVPGAR
jgi:outer membrane protein assembly factor BamB